MLLSNDSMHISAPYFFDFNLWPPKSKVRVLLPLFAWPRNIIASFSLFYIGIFSLSNAFNNYFMSRF
jgi:hypothetical protein